jgi:hypothetical protein
MNLINPNRIPRLRLANARRAVFFSLSALSAESEKASKLCALCVSAVNKIN